MDNLAMMIFRQPAVNSDRGTGADPFVQAFSFSSPISIQHYTLFF
jgi:hypothetical protein